MKKFRNPFIYSNEIYFALKAGNFQEIDKKLLRLNRGKLAAYNARWNQIVNAYLEVESLGFEAEVVISEDIKQLIEKFSNTLYALFFSYSYLFGEEEIKDDREHFDVIYASGEKNDKYQQKLDDIISEIKGILQTVLD